MKPKSISERKRLSIYKKALRLYTLGNRSMLKNMGFGLCQLLRTIYLKQEKFSDSYNYPEYWYYSETPNLFPEIKDIIKKLNRLDSNSTNQQEIDIRIEGLTEIIKSLTK